MDRFFLFSRLQSRRSLLAGVCLVGAGLATRAFAGAPDTRDGVIEGNVVYRERMMLPPGARVEVELADVSRADAPSVTIASARIDDARASPIPYRLSYDPARIDSRGLYALQARIYDGDILIFINTTHHPARDVANASTEILVERVSDSADGEQEVYGSWLAEDIEGGGVIDNAQTTLEIGRDGRAGGHGGCNSYGGEVTIDGDRISFGRMAATMMACAEAVMNQEGKFHDALGRVVSFRIDPDQRKLLLLDEDGKTLIRLASN